MDKFIYKDEIRYELLNGKTVSMSPRPNINFYRVIRNITSIFSNYFKRINCEVFSDVDVHISEKDVVKPDIAVICKQDIARMEGIYGVPSLIAEVLSPSSAKNDKGYKKSLYEKAGVNEYWIVNVLDRSIEVYWLKDGRYELEEVYSIYPEYVLNKMTDEEKGNIKMDFKTSLFDDLIIFVEDVFADIPE